MMTAEELTAAVASTRSNRVAYNGVSDHQTHLQCLTKEGHEPFYCCTFNVLNPRLIGFTSCVRTESLPEAITPESQAGLEHMPAIQAGCEMKRQAIIQHEMEQFIKNSGERWILCLQECWLELQEALLNTAAQFGAHTIGSPKSRSSTSFTVMMISRGLRFDMLPSEEDSVAIWLPDLQLQVVGVHMHFRTQSNITLLKNCLDGTTCDTLVLGDFNIQTQPISAHAKRRGATHTLKELAAWIELQYAKEVRFAMHPFKFTNYNNRINCVRRQHNEEHMDNIMLVSSNPATYQARGIPYTILFG